MLRAAFWIVSHGRYIREARNSSRELGEVMPDLHRILFTTQDTVKTDFDKVAILPPRVGEYWYLDSVRYFNMAFELLSDYDECLYLDSDTNFLAPFPELFEMLERFDIVAPMGSRRVTGATYKKLPNCFPEYEIGVVAFKRNDVVKRLFKKWKELHWAHPEVYGNNDMRSFREAVWEMPDLKIERIPSEYALRWGFGVFMSLPVKILHGRPSGPAYPNSPTIDDVKRIVNEHMDMRIWSPRDPRWRDGVIPPDHD